MILKKRESTLKSMQKFHYSLLHFREKKKLEKKHEDEIRYAIIITMSTNVTSIYSIMEGKNAEVQRRKEELEARYSYHTCMR